MKKLLIAAFVGLGFAGPACAAITLQPGEWQETTTGLEDGKPVAPEVEKSCMTPEEARDATNVVKQMKDQMQKDAGQCQKFEANENGNSVTFALKCGVPQQMSFDISGVFTFISATRYTGSMKSAVAFGGRTMTQDKKIEAVRIGECRPGQSKKR
ncbi:MAG: DUF3617 family protein [Pseudolabrys sp.]|nr:DUF3617 family protein [Pseudolabrys sp.]MBV9954276.1 DUF3617 family protein [Pseudolabrys sp.]